MQLRVVSAAFLLCLSRVQPSNVVYNDKLVRDKIFPMSAAAYADDPSKCINNIFKGGYVSR